MNLVNDSRLVIFESKLTENFYPLSLTRPAFSFLCGTMTLLERIESALHRPATDAIVPKYLERICKETNPKLKINEEISEYCIAVSSHVSPTFSLRIHLEREISEHKSNFILVDRFGDPIAAVFDRLRVEFLNSSVRKDNNIIRTEIVEELKQPPLLKFPWELVSANRVALEEDFKSKEERPTVAENFPRFSKSDLPKTELLGDRLSLSSTANIEDFVTFDSRSGPIFVDEGAAIQSFSRISGPSYVGKHTTVKSARIGEGTSIGSNCRIGGEVEASLILDHTNKHHDGFIGHSLIGSWVNIGAQTNNSDLKNTYGSVGVNINGSMVRTNLNKVGCYVADMVKTSIGEMIFSGKTIGVSSHVFGTVTEDVPSFTLYAKNLKAPNVEMYIESAIETQRRMMERRGLEMSEAFAEMIKSVHSMTAKDRLARKIEQGKFEFS